MLSTNFFTRSEKGLTRCPFDGFCDVVHPVAQYDETNILDQLYGFRCLKWVEKMET